MSAPMHKLPKYYIPQDLKNVVSGTTGTGLSVFDSKSEQFRSILKELEMLDHLELAKCHYLQFLKFGLYLEEHQQRNDMKKFELLGATVLPVKADERKFKIFVKDIDEDNTVLSPMDTLKVQESNTYGTAFFLRIAQIVKDYVHVIADKKFCDNYVSSKKYNMVVIFNNYIFQVCHNALTKVTQNMMTNYLFPEKSTNISQKINYVNTWVHGNVSNNPEQRKAVLNILNKTAVPVPYILYGPPGTGKTTTLVEAVCQIYQQTHDYTLICAPSNAACDVIIKKLILSNFIPLTSMYRIYSQSKEYSAIDDDIKKCCNFTDSGCAIELEKVTDISSKRIIATTLASSSRLSLIQLPFTFSYIFIDEAGQATQPEYLIPLEANNSNCQIVLSGDPHQLGPGIRSKLAEPILGESILQKMMSHEPYKKHVNTGYNPHYLTKLVRNYRSSADIIQVPNALFYDNELIACKDKNKNVNFAITFESVKGKEEKIAESKSSFNNEEASKVLHYVKNFIGRQLGDKVLNEADIGVVTPFTLQVLKIRKMLDAAGLKQIEVGTVELFQGREKEVIIISTVRSKSYLLDGREHLGFLSNPKRFNVALTRAKTYLAVVGNPNILQTDKYWRCFLKFCEKNDAYRGEPYFSYEEISYLIEDLDIGCKSKLSTDVFDENLKFLDINDGIIDFPPRSSLYRNRINYLR